MDRYLIDFDTSEIEKKYYDIVIIGSGIAGVYTALETDPKYEIAILTKEEVDISNSVLAQGGIAVPLDKDDSPQKHMEDTLYAGAGLNNEESVRVLVNEATENIDRLCKYGVNFDKSQEDKRKLALTREAAHSQNRIIHVGDSTGREVTDTLIENVMKRDNVTIHERTWAIDLLVKDSKAYGLIAIKENTKKKIAFIADIIVCASGGYGQLYYYTTNPPVTTGDGAALAYRAGCRLEDMEFIQFHPTVLYHPKNKSFLISEAVRGEGAILRNSKGERFMTGYHELAELAPRDVVARSIFVEMKKTNAENVYLDISHKDSEYVKKRFPMIYRTCLEYGIDITKDYIPVAPAEHYCMGGIKVDVYGHSDIENFFSCGEAAGLGIHGANRLASNSLLEGIVFGRRIAKQAESILLKTDSDEKKNLEFSYKSNREKKDYDSAAAIYKIKKIMTENVGIKRSEEGLLKALDTLLVIKEEAKDISCEGFSDIVLQNMLVLSEIVIRAALFRKESRGAHYRSDYPETSEEWNFHKLFHKTDDYGGLKDE